MQFQYRFIFLLLAVVMHSAGAVSTVSAQSSPFLVADQRFKDREGRLDYVGPLQVLIANKHSFDSNTYEQALSTYQSFVGKVGAVATEVTSPAPTTPYRLSEVAPQLNARARATSVVLLNEAHDQPVHRAYCQQLLRQLVPLGYTYFAVEALDPGEKAINQRKFPLSYSGFYTCEPNMGKLLRAATESGFQVFSHEISEAQEKEFNDWKKRSNYRDSMQAVNILAVLRKAPQAKIVALVGHDHVLEKEQEGVKRLATYLRELGNINPLTIDQTLIFSSAASKSQVSPMLLTTDTGIPITAGGRAGLVDLQVIHPIVTWINNRPIWLYTYASAKPITVNVPPANIGQPNLVQLYDEREYKQYGDKAVPLDQYLTDGKQQQVYLFTYAPNRPVVIKYRPAKLQ